MKCRKFLSILKKRKSFQGTTTNDMSLIEKVIGFFHFVQLHEVHEILWSQISRLRHQTFISKFPPKLFFFASCYAKRVSNIGHLCTTLNPHVHFEWTLMQTTLKYFYELGCLAYCLFSHCTVPISWLKCCFSITHSKPFSQKVVYTQKWHIYLHALESLLESTNLFRVSSIVKNK